MTFSYLRPFSSKATLFDPAPPAPPPPARRATAATRGEFTPPWTPQNLAVGQVGHWRYALASAAAAAAASAFFTAGLRVRRFFFCGASSPTTMEMWLVFFVT